MASIFTIEPADNQVEIKAGQSGEMRFVVTNPIAQSLDGKIRVTPKLDDEGAETPAWMSWLAIEGETVRTYAAQEASTHTVKITVPEDATPDTYRYRLEAATERDPDHEITVSPTVAFVVKPTGNGGGGGGSLKWILIAVGALLVLGGGGFGIYKLLSGGPSPEIAAFTADPAKIERGQSTNLAWETKAVETLTLNGEAVDGETGREVSPTETTTYRLEGKSDDETASAEVTVHVEAPVPGATIVRFKAQKRSVVRGQSTQLQWTTKDAEIVRLDGAAVSGTGNKAVSPTSNTTYTLVAEGGGKAPSRRIQIRVTNPPPKTCFNSIQNRIAWNLQGNKRWNPNNVNFLCRGAEGSREPGKCFQAMVHSGVRAGRRHVRLQWPPARNLCRGTLNARNTIRCFQSEMGRGRTINQGVNACKRPDQIFFVTPAVRSLLESNE